MVMLNAGYCYDSIFIYNIWFQIQHCTVRLNINMWHVNFILHPRLVSETRRRFFARRNWLTWINFVASFNAWSIHSLSLAVRTFAFKFSNREAKGCIVFYGLETIFWFKKDSTFNILQVVRWNYLDVPSTHASNIYFLKR